MQGGEDDRGEGLGEEGREGGVEWGAKEVRERPKGGGEKKFREGGGEGAREGRRSAVMCGPEAGPKESEEDEA